MTSATIKAYPSFKFATVTASFATPLNSSDAYYDAVTTVYEESPDLGDLGISAYYFSVVNESGADYGVPGMINGFGGVFLLPLMDAANTSDSLQSAVNATMSKAIKGAEDQFFTSVTAMTYDDFWTYYKDNNGPPNAGGDSILGSRLLDRKALTEDRTALKEALTAVARGSGTLLGHLVSGKAAHNGKIPGGSNSVHPAWRSAYVHVCPYPPAREVGDR